MPPEEIQPTGNVVLQHAVRESRPVAAYQRWISKIPGTYRTAVLGVDEVKHAPSAADDPYCLAQLKHYRSLMPLGMEAKPIFYLKPADWTIAAMWPQSEIIATTFGWWLVR